MERDFRHQARQAVARAKALMVGENIELAQLRYAALDVRMAMEALTYERAHAYRRELPESAYETWQPRKLLQVLLDIDPSADRDRTLRYGKEETFGEPARVMRNLGHETVLNLATLKKHYDALGSYLHMPTLKQLKADDRDSVERLRMRLDGIVAYLDKVLSSRIFNVNFGNFTTQPCMRCKKEIRWRIPHEQESVEAECRECGALYDIEILADNQVHWRPKQQPVPCANPECIDTLYLWEEHVRPGTIWTCGACAKKNELVLTVTAFVEHAENASVPQA